MKIRKIEAIPYRILLKEPFNMAHFTVKYMHYVLIKLETDVGLIGYGESTPAWEVNGENGDSIVGFIRLITNKSITGYSLIGEDISTQEKVEQLIDTVINPVNTAALIAGNSAAKAGLEQALYDVFCIYSKKSFIRQYSLQNISIPCSTTISIADINSSKKQIQKVLKQNPLVIRLKIGKKNVDGALYHRDITVIKEAKKLLSNQKRCIKLVADANQGFDTVEDAISFCQKVEGDLDWLEQPLPADNMLGFKEIKKHCTVPLMADESITCYKDAQVLLQLGGVDYLNIKMMKVGGVRGALQIIDLAKKYHVSCYIGSMIESVLGISMGCLVYLLRPDIIGTDLNVYELLAGQIAKGITTNGSYVQLSQQYTLGEKIEPEKLSHYQYKF